MKRISIRLTILLCFSSFFTITASSKVLIITHSFCRPDLIEIQNKTFKAFLQDNYEFVVFNDGPNQKMAQAIENTCNKLNIRCIRIPQEIHARPYLKRLPGENWNNPSCRTANVVQYSLDTLGFDHNGIVVIIDSDMFLIKDFSIVKYLEGFNFVGLAQGRNHIRYVWNGLVFMDMRTLPNKRTINFNCGRIEGQQVDTGGHMYYYFKNNPTIRLKWYIAMAKIEPGHPHDLPRDAKSLRALGYDENSIDFILSFDKQYGFEFHADKHFIHYHAGGSNWPGYSQSWLNEKNRLLNQYIDQQIATYKNTTE